MRLWKLDLDLVTRYGEWGYSSGKHVMGNGVKACLKRADMGHAGGPLGCDLGVTTWMLGGTEA